MIPALIVLLVLAGLEAGLLFAGRYLLKELRRYANDVTQQRDLARQEVQALTDALARAGRTPILRNVNQSKKLEPSETWYGGKPEVTKVTAS